MGVPGRSLGATRTRVWFSSPVPEILIVTEAATARGCRTVRIAIERSSARSAVANRAAALDGIGSRGVGSRIAVLAIGLWVGALYPTLTRKMPVLTIPIRARFIVLSLRTYV
jgi:hypothetical protein